MGTRLVGPSFTKLLLLRRLTELGLHLIGEALLLPCIDLRRSIG